MSDIILGTNFKLYYNTDLGNSSPQGVGNVLINELSELPELNISSETNSFETYDSDYVSKLLSDMTVGEMGFTVNYIPTDPTHQFLDNAALKQTEFQLVLEYSFNLDTKTVSYAIVNGNIVSTQLSGDKDQVVQKSYTFVHQQVMARSMVATIVNQLDQGDFGVGSNGITVAQYSPDKPTGNSFIKIPASQSGNPASADMMGIGWTDNNQVCEFAVTKSGALGIYAKNANTAWTRIYTVSQSDAAYVPLTRTVNGKPLSANVTLSKSDIGLSTVTDDAQLKIASNLADVASVPAARINLGLGTAAVQNIGTSGANVPLMSTNNTWSGVQTFVGRTFITNLASTTAGTYNGTANVTQGVTGTLPVASGGTGASTPEAARASLGVTYGSTSGTVTQGNDPRLSTVDGNTGGTITGNLSVSGTSASRENIISYRQLLSRTDAFSPYTVYNRADQVDGVLPTAVTSIGDITGRLSTTTGDPYGRLLGGITFQYNTTGGGRTVIAARSTAQSITSSIILDGDAAQATVAGALQVNGNLSATSLALSTALPVASGGTGNKNGTVGQLTTPRSFITNLGSTGAVNFDGTANVTQGVTGTLPVANGGTGNTTGIANNVSGVVAIANGGTGANSVDGARNNFGLGKGQDVQFSSLNLNTTGLQNSGIVYLNITNSSNAITSQARMYHEMQSGLGKLTLHVNANSKNRYYQFDENGLFSGVNNINASGTISAGAVSSTGNVFANQGNSVGVLTQNGGNKNIYIQNVNGDADTGGWVNLIQGNWYQGYWQLGAIRGGGPDIQSVRLGINNQGTNWKTFDFYDSYGGYIQAGRGYKGTGSGQGWGGESSYMTTPFYTDTVLGNQGGWVPLISGGSANTVGYRTRVAFGVIGDSSDWSSAAIKLHGDDKYHRAFMFSKAGEITTWGQDGGWDSSYTFQRAATSDRTLKHDIQYTDGKESYDRVMQWLPTMFKYNGQDTQRYGLIAQDLQKIDPQYVVTVQGSPIFEMVDEVDEETGETKTVSKQTDKNNPDTLALDNNVVLVDLACAFKYLASEIDQLKQMMNK